jgi:class 3 adenylate cyclase
MGTDILTVSEYLKSIGPKEATFITDGALTNEVRFPLCGLDTVGAVIFADLPGYSTILYEQEDPGVGVYLINHFFSWIKGEGIYRYGALLDKYIGDEIMLVLPIQRCDRPPLEAALLTAKKILNFDLYSFRPRIGIAAGRFILAYIGPLSEGDDINPQTLIDASTIGHTVNVAARCVQGISKSETACIRVASEDIEMVNKVFIEDQTEAAIGWEVLPVKEVTAKNINELKVIDIKSTRIWLHSRHRVTENGETGRIKGIKDHLAVARGNGTIFELK